MERKTEGERGGEREGKGGRREREIPLRWGIILRLASSARKEQEGEGI